MASAPNQLPEDDASIAGDEYALRRVHPDLARTGTPESSVFKDDPGGIGTSVTLWRSRLDLEIVTAGKLHVGVVAVQVSRFRDAGLGIAFTFEDGNPNHCEVFGPRTKGKLRTLRDSSRWVRCPEGVACVDETELFQLYPDPPEGDPGC